MRRAIWEWIVDADDWIIEAVLDAAVAVLLAAAAVASLRFLIAFLSAS
jgi:hypothetical protein